MNLVSIESYVAVSLMLFCTGLYTAMVRKNLIGILIGIELILNAGALNFAAFSRFRTGGLEGQLFSVFIIVVAAAEVAIALAFLLAVYRQFGDISADRLTRLRG